MKKIILFNSIILLAFVFINGCQKGDDSLSPYAGSPNMKEITVENGTFKPKITWVGGYASVIGVNRGERAAVDTSLIWLVYAPSNSITYPITYGKLPQGLQNMTSNFGGKSLDSLEEDKLYTYWVMKEEAWNQISANAKGKVLAVDSSLNNTVVQKGDTIKISPSYMTKKAQAIDVFVNISDVAPFGRLAQIDVLQPVSSPDVVVTWTLTQDGVTDPVISAIGVNEGIQYEPTINLWEVWSLETSGGKEIYGKKNVISQPVKLGQKISGTKVFAEFTTSAGFIRGHDYYVWIASKEWNGVDRERFTPYYAYAMFHVY